MKILILSASTGGGHKRAAAAIENKIKSISPETEVVTVDALKAIGKVYDKTVCEGYHFMATKIPQVYGGFYKITDQDTPIYKAVMGSNTLMGKKLLKIIEDHSPDAIIICHPFVTTMISKLKHEGKITAKAISLITDYDAHRTYIVSDMDAYVLPEPHMALKLEKEFNVDKKLIYPYGIPILDKFSEPFDREALCRRAGLDPDKRTVLLMAGSFGVTAVLDFYEALAIQGIGLQFIVITGRNRKLFEHIEELTEELCTQDNTKLLYFVENVEDYMHIADVIVTKPGGLTVTESLACHLPLAIYNAFPGQEQYNADFLVNAGAAISLHKKNGAKQVIDLLGDTERLNKMKESCKKLAISDSAEKIFNLAKQLCSASSGKEI
ncbi:MAG: glycosyltransferase [Ruminococcus sp.]|nr:glycosyltransferase [Ruminococcus sp.]